MWGNDAMNFCKFIRAPCESLTYKHPSPLAQTKEPLFIDCPHFDLLSRELGIDWHPMKKHYFAVDGSSNQNITCGYALIYWTNNPKFQNIIKYENLLKTYEAQTNNVGELHGVLTALKIILTKPNKYRYTIYTDSRYSILAVSNCKSWFDNKKPDIANLELVREIYNIVIQLKANSYHIEIEHVDGHVPQKTANLMNKKDYTMWLANYIVDDLADKSREANVSYESSIIDYNAFPKLYKFEKAIKDTFNITGVYKEPEAHPVEVIEIKPVEITKIKQEITEIKPIEITKIKQEITEVKPVEITMIPEVKSMVTEINAEKLLMELKGNKPVLPKVVLMKKQKGIVVNPYDIYIGPKLKSKYWDLTESKWNNHFDDLEKYREYIKANKMNELPELFGKTLGCFCKKDSTIKCHGDILIEIIKTLS
jgi:ribonuclease HI